jgi:hypothetical protein
MQRELIYRCFIGIILSLFSLIGFPGDAYATHEADHRFTISGYVRDGSGNPLPDALVLLEHKGGVKKETNAGPRGYYEAMFHLHNNNLGDEILVSVGDTVKKLRVQFDPDDTFTDRRSDPVDFGAPGKELPSDWIYWAGGIGLIICTLASLRFLKKKKPKEKRRNKDKARKKR